MPRPTLPIRPLTDDERSLVETLIPWVESGVEKYFRRSSFRADRDELRQSALIGLIRAAQKYRPENGTSFKTYAMFWTENYLRRVYLLDLRANGYSWSSTKKRSAPMTKRLDRCEMPSVDDYRLRVDRTDLDEMIFDERRRLLFSACRTDVDRAILIGKLDGLSSRTIGKSLGYRPKQIDNLWQNLRVKLERVAKQAA